MSQEPSFALDDSQFFVIAPGNIISGAHLKYLCCLLNSNLIYFGLRKFYMGGGIEGELKTNRLLILPVKYPTKDEEYTFENFYNERKINSEVDKFINDSIYRMYGLSQAEIDYIEQKRSD